MFESYLHNYPTKLDVSNQVAVLGANLTGCVLQVISHTAIQEFKIGSAERGRSMFESCLRSYPARLDVWSQYLDQVCI